MCLATALDKAFEKIDCMSVIPRCQAKNRFYESTQRLIQPRRVLCLLSLDRKDFDALIEQHPKTGTKLYNNLLLTATQRIRRTNEAHWKTIEKRHKEREVD
jgi:hypothetical protein